MSSIVILRIVKRQQEDAFRKCYIIRKHIKHESKVRFAMKKKKEQEQLENKNVEHVAEHHRLVCPDCGRDISDVFKAWQSKINSDAMKGYWAEMTPKKELHKKNFLDKAKEARVMINSDHDQLIENGRRLFRSVDMETRGKYIKKAIQARKEKLPEILEKLRQTPEHHEMVRKMKRNHIIKSAKRRYDKILQCSKLDHSKPIVWVRIIRYKKDFMANISSPAEVKQLLCEIKPLRDKPLFFREMPEVAPDGVKYQTIYCEFNPTPLVICEVVGLDLDGYFTRKSDELTT